MRHSEFWELMTEEFGAAYAASLAHDLALTPLGSRTASEALAEGVEPRTVWEALCEASGVAPEHRRGRERRPRR